MTFENLRVEHNGPVCRVIINRPKTLNALNQATLAELNQVFSDLANDSATRAIILTGAGEKAFVAGADINELRQLSATGARAFAEYGQRVFSRIEQSSRPVIAAVNGFALGGGLELAMACHLRLASDNARLGLPEIKLGIMPGFGGTQRLSRLIGKAKALELALTGDPVTADQAQTLGLVNQVFSADELIPQAEQLAGRLAASAAESVRGILQAVQLGLEGSLENGFALEAARFAVCCATDDMKEGTSAFLEKRAAEFKGD